MKPTDKALRVAEDVVFAWNNKHSKTPTGDAAAIIQQAMDAEWERQEKLTRKLRDAKRRSTPRTER